MPEGKSFSFDLALPAFELFSGDGRLARVAWLSKLINEDDLYFLQDGALSRYLFIEVVESFVAGQFIAIIVLGFTFIERAVAGRLYFNGEETLAKANSEKLLSAALERKWISSTEHAHLDELRKRRNPIVHFRDYLDMSRPEVRAVLDAKTTPELLAADAKHLIEATFTVLKKTAL